MDLLEDVGPRLVEDLVTALELVEVVEGQVGGLQLGAHRAVAHQNALGQGVQQVGVVGTVVRGNHKDGVVIYAHRLCR